MQGQAAQIQLLQSRRGRVSEKTQGELLQVNGG